MITAWGTSDLQTADRMTSPPLPRYKRAFSMAGTTPATRAASLSCRPLPTRSSASVTSARPSVAPWRTYSSSQTPVSGHDKAAVHTKGPASAKMKNVQLCALQAAFRSALFHGHISKTQRRTTVDMRQQD